MAADPSSDAFVDALSRRDRAAWGAFYDAHVREIYAFVNHLMEGERRSTDDVNQDVWLQALSSIGNFDPKRGELRDWLFGIARRRVALHFRKRFSAAASLSANPVSLSDPVANSALADEELLLPHEIMEQVERKRLVQAAIIAIPEVHRHVLDQKYVQGRSVVEIAAAMEMTAKAVESLLWRARSRLRVLLGSYFLPAAHEGGVLP